MTETMREFHPCMVVSTTGRIAALERLFESLAKQTYRKFTVGVCDQSTSSDVQRLVGKYQKAFDVFITNSERGLSAGRNSVISTSPSNCTHFLFPNDTTYYSPDFLEMLSRQHSAADVAAFAYVDQRGIRYVFQDGMRPLDKRNVWKVIEAGMLVSKCIMPADGFDENLGTGAPTPWQSGEGTDLLLKTLSRNPVIHWNSGLRVYGVTQDEGLTNAQRRAKLRAYGRGYGYLHRRWQYPLSRRLIICGAPLIRSLLSRNSSLLDATSSAIGRFEGVSGLILGSK